MFTDKKVFDVFRNDVNEAMKEISKKYSCTVDMGSISYSNKDLHFKITCITNNLINGKKAEQLMFEDHCHHYGFQPEDYWRTVVINKKEFTFVGFYPKASKNVCKIVELGTEKEFSINKDAIQKQLKRGKYAEA